MSRRLAALRRALDAMPSPVEDRPGLLLRDPFGYTEAVVIVPPPLVRFLRFFDGEHDEAVYHAGKAIAKDTRFAQAAHQRVDCLFAHAFATCFRPDRVHDLFTGHHAAA